MQEAPSDPSLRPGNVVGGKYRIEHELGSGGMGVVLAARHLELGQRVALKVLRPDCFTGEVVERFLREARAAAQLGGEHIARVMDVGRLESGAPYLVMEFLDGCDAAALLAGGPLSVLDAVGIVIQACEGLAEAHAAGIVHRDVKPHNLFVATRRDGTPCVKVLDFGIAHHSEATGGAKLTTAAMVMGSPPYMSPEQMTSSANVDARSDVWSLGATLYELLTGRVPFAGGGLAEIYARTLQGPPEDILAIRPEVPEALAHVVRRCLSQSPADRYPHAGSLAEALAPFAPASLTMAPRLAGAAAAVAQVTRIVPVRRRRGAWVIALAAGSVIGATVAVGLIATKLRSGPASSATRAISAPPLDTTIASHETTFALPTAPVSASISPPATASALSVQGGQKEHPVVRPTTTAKTSVATLASAPPPAPTPSASAKFDPLAASRK